MCKYDKLFLLLNEKNIEPSVLLRDCNISRGTLKRLRNNCNVSVYTLELISAYLGCSVLDLISISE